MEEIKNYDPKSDNNRGFSDNNKKKTIIKGDQNLNMMMIKI